MLSPRWTLYSIILVILTAPAKAGEAPGLEGVQWELLAEKDGIASWRAEVPGSRLVAFRAQGRIPASLFKVANVLVDAARRREWMPELREGRVLRQKSPSERLEYSRFHTPLFVSERDFVVRAWAELDVPARQILFRFESTEDELGPETDCVRGRLLASGYRLRETEAGAATEVDFWSHVDPQGSVAKWIVNAFQKRFPRRMLEAIRQQAEKPDVAEHEGMRAAFAR